MKYEYDNGLKVDGNYRYCPLHGAGGEVCRSWCAMFEHEQIERGLEFVVCHAYKTKFKLESYLNTNNQKGAEI